MGKTNHYKYAGQEELLIDEVPTMTEQPDDAQQIAEEWERDCLHWRGLVLTGRYAHWCMEWDGLPMDETCPEWPCRCGIEDVVNGDTE